jgi:hypothetical protein
MATEPTHVAVLATEEQYDGELTSELPVVDYEFVGSMYMFDLADGSSRSYGTGVVKDVRPVED